MKPLLSTLLTALVLGGCTHVSFERDRALARQTFEREVTAAENSIEGTLVAIDCADKSIPSKDIQGYAFQAQQCGLLFDDLLTKNQLKNEICPPLGLKGKKCDEKVRQTFIARANARYWEYPGKNIEAHCELYPVACVDLRQLEMHAIETHNREAEKHFIRDLDVAKAKENQENKLITAEERVEEQERRQRISNGLQSMSESMKPKPTLNCTSTKRFGTVSTQCREY